jgi:hypothetical protein
MEFFRQAEMISRRGLSEEPPQGKLGSVREVSESPRNGLISMQFETVGAEAIHEPHTAKTQSEL